MSHDAKKTVDMRKKSKMRKKADQSIDLGEVTQTIKKVVECDLQYLWKSRKVDQELVNKLFDTGFNLIEFASFKRPSERATFLEPVYSFLKETISRFGHSLGDSATSENIITKVTSLLYKVEDIATNLASFITSFSEQNPHSLLVNDLVRKLTDTVDTSDVSHESVGMKNVATFLTELSGTLPD